MSLLALGSSVTPASLPGLLPGLAMLLAGVAVWFTCRPGRAPGGTTRLLAGRRPGLPGPGSARPGPWLLAAVGAGCLLAWADGSALVLAGAGMLAFGGAARLVLRARRRKEADSRADRVLGFVEELSAELRSGLSPVSALGHCARAWPELAPAAAAAELGGDVPAALRRLAEMPGADALRQVAAAWTVSQHSGATMSAALARVADATRRTRATQQQVLAELASAHATARLVAVLPLAVLGLGSSLGGDPWSFLLKAPGGLACLVMGLGLSYLGLAWLERIATSATR